MTNIGFKLGIQGVEQVQAGLNQVNTSLGKLQGTTDGVASAISGRLTGALAGLLSAGALARLAKQAVDSADALNDAADATGASIEQLSRLERVARLNGGTLDTVTGAVVKFNAALREADGKNGASLALESIGLNAEKLKALDPALALQEVAQALDGFADDGTKARITQELFGKSLREVAPLLKDMVENTGAAAATAAEQAKQAERLNKHIFAMQTAVSDAAREIVGSMLPALNDWLDRVRQLNEAGIAKGWMARFAEDFKAARVQAVSEEIERLQARLANPNITGFNRSTLSADLLAAREQLKELRAELDQATDARRKLFGARDAGAGRGFVVPEAVKPSAEDPAAIKARKDALEALFKVEEARAKLEREQRAAADLKRQLEYDKAEAATTEALAKAKADLGEAIYKSIDASFKEVVSLEQTVKALELENEAIGLNGVALAELTSARLRAAAADKEMQGAAANDEALIRQAELLRKQADLVVANAVKQANADASKDAADEWKKSFEQIGQSLTDELMRGGKNAGRLLKDYFQTLVLQPVIKAIVTPVAAGITGALGLGSTAAQAGQGGGGPGLQTLGSISNIKAAFSQASPWLTDFGGQVGNLYGQFASSSMGQYFGLNVVDPISGMTTTGMGVGQSAVGEIASAAGDIAGYATALYDFTQGRYGAAAGAAIGTYFGGPIGAAIGRAIGGWVDKLAANGAGTPTRGADVFSNGRTVGDPLAGVVTSAFGTDAAFQRERSTQAEQFLAPLALTSAEALNKLSALTGGLQQFSVGLQFATDGTNDTRGAIKLLADGATIAAKAELKFSNDLTQATKEFSGELALSMIDAIKSTITLPQMFADELKAIETQIGGPTIQSLAAFTDRVVALLGASKQMAEAFKLLPGSFAQISGLTDELRIKLAELFGGFQNASAAIGQYYEAFYTEQERAAFTTQQLTATLKSLGINSLPQTREAFRTLVDAQDLATEAGRKTYAALIALAPAFAQITQEARSLAETLVDQASRAIGAARDERIEAARAINARADEFAAIGRNLRAFVFSQSSTEKEQFGDALKKALGGDQDALKALPDLARRAAAEQQAAARNQFEATRAQQLILNDVAAAAAAAENEAKKRVAVPEPEDPILQLTRDLIAATGGLGQIIPSRLLAGLDASGMNATQFAAAFGDELSQAQLDRLFAVIDADGDGIISQLEAIRASTASLIPAFEAFDRNLDGILTAPELRAALGIASQSISESIIGGIDANGDRQITLLEAINNSNLLIAAQLGAEAQRFARGTPANVATINAAYQNVLGRNADREGLAFYGSSGYSQMQIERELRKSTEGQRNLPAYIDTATDRAINTIYIDLLNRFADQGGLDFYAGLVTSGQATFADVAADIRRSAEFARVPQFAEGGYYPGGMALVGEEGPELINFRNPGQVYTSDQSMRMMMGVDMSGVEQRLERIEALMFNTAKHSGDMSNRLRRLDDGNRLRVTIDQQPGETLITQVAP